MFFDSGDDAVIEFDGKLADGRFDVGGLEESASQGVGDVDVLGDEFVRDKGPGVELDLRVLTGGGTFGFAESLFDLVESHALDDMFVLDGLLHGFTTSLALHGGIDQFGIDDGQCGGGSPTFDVGASILGGNDITGTALTNADADDLELGSGWERGGERLGILIEIDVGWLVESDGDFLGEILVEVKNVRVAQFLRNGVQKRGGR